ncbi:hypothetical protein GCM10009738_82740 [Kitasatospora viridis]
MISAPQLWRESPKGLRNAGRTRTLEAAWQDHLSYPQKRWFTPALRCGGREA